MTMPSEGPSQTVAGTLSLIEICEWELERLRKIRADYRDSIEASRRLITRCRETAGQNQSQIAPAPQVRFPRPPSQFCIERAEETRAFAENVNDPLVRRLLLEIAEGYDKAAK